MQDTATQYRHLILESEGFFGPYGGCYVPEVLQPALQQMARAFDEVRHDAAFLQEFQETLRLFSGRETPLTPLPRLSAHFGGARIFLKNEGLNHTGAHKINHCIGQALLARRLGKTRIIAETGAGQHGYATAAVCARLGLQCTVYMGRKDYERQRPNVYWMELLGATVVPVEDGAQTLNDAVIAAFKDWVAHPEETYYLLGSAVGPHPFPAMNTFFQKVVGEEIGRQCREQTGQLPDVCVACVGGGSNALGMFYHFLDTPEVQLIGVEAGGRGKTPGEHAAKLRQGQVGIFEGYHSYFLQDGQGNIAGTHSVSAGLDYCGVSPILAFLADEGRVQFETASDAEALQAVQSLARLEGIIPALESAHAFAYAFRLATTLPPEAVIVVNASGRGEKDLFITMRHFQEESLRTYAQHLLDTPAKIPAPAPPPGMPAGAPLRPREQHLMGHLVLGYPSMEESIRTALLYAQKGVQILELQIPFSHPTADGPVITRACQKAVEQAGCSVANCLEAVAAIRRQLPRQEIILMSYLNRISTYGLEAFEAQAAQLGIRHLIVPDLPVDSPLAQQFQQLQLVPVLAANTPPERLQALLEQSFDFFYFMSDFNITGSGFSLHPHLAERIAQVRRHGQARSGIGFGISNAAQVDIVLRHADVAILGSALISAQEAGYLEALLSG
jgi:tryptophan synthase beta chain